ncbi:2-polyprenyl-6-methoxyphenol hydroxylase-like FAD-dependent oxidoreductase [Amycolatopsis bartoniae]|uniref:Putative aromatic compound monooxygenase YhjG n=1 Tax=Amycolatopsis bartoniae TaxID=941986 RepID=A0A8H9MFN4_9PSEU|nr:FAD-dependent monooxygenase [Amycolatopsis bartoniae]MBB2934128.1 2-polyprenyl-6-methoxyphenol hydroxylase-like FAD-dependent oxidoreductase [Amycolatopsis bartoniae]TVT05510.1 monooxygenase [Amycolatopsis bartoniae]GHF84154.1 putative aromatic compound monooxygenase YhjG [Amycolatopsis bartoniae]
MNPVVIAGAGPVGLWLAAELRLAGVGVTVLEPRLAPDPHSKALTIHPRTIELFACRGLADRFLGEGFRIPSGHFASLDHRLDFGVLDTDFRFTLAIPQARTEELLEEHARVSGVDLKRGHRLLSLSDNENSVVIDAEGPDGAYRLEAEYVVGCDGTRSTVRQAAGIAFPGTSYSVLGWLADVSLDFPPPGGAFSAGNGNGGLMVVPLPDGKYRLVGSAPEDVRGDWPGDLTLDEVRGKAVAAAGTDFGAHSPVWLSRFTNAARQAERYRAGRVLLAGDAAHQHMPAGGVGLNVGVQDAMNLGWKLAAAVKGEADLLDTYHDERHAVGVDLLESTQAQTSLMTAFSPDGQQLRGLLSKLLAEHPSFARGLAERLSGLSVRYPAGDGHPLTGVRAPNLRFADGTTLFDRLRSGRHVTVDFRHDELAEDRAEWKGLTTATIRPDGHVASAA